MDVDEKDLQETAEKRAEEILGFHHHLTIYLVVNFMIFVIWLVIFLFNRDAWFPWFLFPLLGWGIGVFFHGLGVYRPEADERRKKELYERELAKLKKGEIQTSTEEPPSSSQAPEGPWVGGQPPEEPPDSP